MPKITMPALTSAVFETAVAGEVVGFDEDALELVAKDAAVVQLRNVSAGAVTAQIVNAGELAAVDSNIANLAATVENASTLSLEDINPVGAATLHVRNVSHATINLAAGGSLTGSAEALSKIGYFGTDVALDVLVDDTSTVKQLGETRL